MKGKKERERPFQSPCVPPRQRWLPCVSPRQRWLPCALQGERERGRMDGGREGRMDGGREGSMQPGTEGEFVRVSEQTIERAHARMRKNVRQRGQRREEESETEKGQEKGKAEQKETREEETEHTRRRVSLGVRTRESKRKRREEEPPEHPCDSCTSSMLSEHSKNEHVTMPPRVGKECAGHSTCNSSCFSCNVSDLVVLGPTMFCLGLLKSTPVHTLSQGNDNTTQQNNLWILSRAPPSTSNYA